VIETMTKFIRPTVAKLLFPAPWLAYILLRATQGWISDLGDALVVLWPVLPYYLLGCMLVAYSQRSDRIARGRVMAALVVAAIILDQVVKSTVALLLAEDQTVPVVEGWLHLTNLHNPNQSWIAPMWYKPVHAAQAVLALPLSVLVYRYYISSRRRSLWADLALVSALIACSAYLCDTLLRGYTLDFLQIRGGLASDLKDLFVPVCIASALAELLDSENRDLLAWRGWRTELDDTSRLVKDFASFAARELRSWWPSSERERHG
jgi:lipoprotein signal peptidase